MRHGCVCSATRANGSADRATLRLTGGACDWVGAAGEGSGVHAWRLPYVEIRVGTGAHPTSLRIRSRCVASARRVNEIGFCDIPQLKDICLRKLPQVAINRAQPGGVVIPDQPEVGWAPVPTRITDVKKAPDQTRPDCHMQKKALHSKRFFSGRDPDYWILAFFISSSRKVCSLRCCSDSATCCLTSSNGGILAGRTSSSLIT
jgi:hypothetical protein